MKIKRMPVQFLSDVFTAAFVPGSKVPETSLGSEDVDSGENVALKNQIRVLSIFIATISTKRSRYYDLLFQLACFVTCR